MADSKNKTLKAAKTTPTFQAETTTIFDKLDKLLVPLYIEDELFETIKAQPGIAANATNFKFALIALFAFSLLFLVLGLVTMILFFSDKAYTWTVGLASVLHLVGCPVALSGFRRQQRSFLLWFAVLNALWILIACNTYFIWVFGVSSTLFRSDILFHVFLWLYVSAAGVAVWFEFILFVQLITFKAPDWKVDKETVRKELHQATQKP